MTCEDTVTFSSTVRASKICVAWNVRAMPRSTRLGVLRFVMSRDPNRTRPLDSGTYPEMILNTVLLPEPFGPISPRMAPLSTVKLRFLTAASPPKKCVTFSSASSDMRWYRAWPRSGENSFTCACDAFREEAHDGNQHRAIHQRFQKMKAAQVSGENPKPDCSDNRAPKIGHSADHDINEKFEHRVNSEIGRVDHAARVGEKDAGDAGQEAGKAQDQKLAADGVNSDRTRHRLGLLDRSALQTQPRVFEPDQNGRRRDPERQDEVVERNLADERQREAAEAERIRPRNADQSGRAAEGLLEIGMKEELDH